MIQKCDDKGIVSNDLLLRLLIQKCLEIQYDLNWQNMYMYVEILSH